jgi:hypothetical protein
VLNSIYSQVNFNEIENRKIQFMHDYKQQLFQLLAKDSCQAHIGL